MWCNPPYSNIGPWVAKALSEVEGGCLKVVMLLPANRCEQLWWQELIEPMRDRGLNVTTRFLKGRPRFGWPTEKPRSKRGDRPPFGLVVIVITPSGDWKAQVRHVDCHEGVRKSQKEGP